jgi:hypothetical protein
MMNKLVVMTHTGSTYIVDLDAKTISGGYFSETVVPFELKKPVMIGERMTGTAFVNGEWGVLSTSAVEKIARA